MSVNLTILRNHSHVLIGGVEAITPEVMDKVAEELNAQYKSSGSYTDGIGEDGKPKKILSIPFDPTLYLLSEVAEKTAKHMRANRIDSVPAIFGFSLSEVVIPAKGSEYLVKKGTLISSTHPDYKGGKKIPLARSQKIVVSNVHRGHYNDHHATDGIGWNPPQVSWAGSGGYWKYANL